MTLINILDLGEVLQNLGLGEDCAQLYVRLVILGKGEACYSRLDL